MKLIEEFLSHITQFGEKTALYYFPENEGLNGPCETMSYRELIKKVNILTLALKEKYKEGDIISVHFAKTHEYVPHMLAIWNAGMVYHPDKNPIKKNIAQKECRDNPGNLCYVISSSGSSGFPKDIGIPWDALFSRVEHQAKLLKLSNEDCMLGYLDHAWDASLMEALCPLYAGASFFISPANVHKEKKYVECFTRANEENVTITCAILLPEIIENFSHENFSGLTRIVSTGASIKGIDQFKKWRKAGIRIFNGWGPTESTIGGTLVDITDKPICQQKFLIYEKPSDTFEGIELFFFKYEGEFPESIQHEGDYYQVFIGGNGLGVYLNPSETQKKSFIDKEQYQEFFKPEEILELKQKNITRVFKTGDVFQKIENCFYFLCRIDRMVKVDGTQFNLDLIDITLKEQNPKSFFITIYNHPPKDSKNSLLRTFFTGTLEKPTLHPCYEINPESENAIFPGDSKPKTDIQLLMNSSRPYKVILENNTQRDIQKILSTYFLENDIPLHMDAHLRHDAGLSSYDFLSLSLKLEEYIAESFAAEKPLAIANKLYNYLYKHPRIKQIAALVDALKISYLSPDNFTLLQNMEIEQESDKKDALVLSLLNELKQKQPGHFYILRTDREWLQEELFEWIKADDEKVVIVTNDAALEKAKQERIKFSISRKLKKVYPAIYQRKASVDEEKESQFVQNVSLPSGNTLFLLGSICSGKTITLRSILHQTHEVFCVYFSLANNSVRTIEELLKLSSFNFSEEEIKLLLTGKVVFLIDDYDASPIPIFFPKNAGASIIIACRTRYFYYHALKASTIHCQQNRERSLNPYHQKEYFGETNEENYYTPNNIYSFHELMRHEKQKLRLSLLTLPNLQYWENKEIYLDGYVSAFKKLPYERKLHNLPHFAFILELLSCKSKEPAVYFVEKKQLRYIRHWNEHDVFVKTPQISFFEKSAISLKDSPDLEILGRGNAGIPIFSFAPMTGFAPKEYALYARDIAKDHPFYCFTFNNRTKPSQSFEERIEQYVQAIITIQPKGDILLLGYSFGTIQAFAVAKTLREKGREIAMLINIDTPSPKDIQEIKNKTEGSLPNEKLATIKHHYPDALKAGYEQAKINFKFYSDFADQTHEQQPFRMTVFSAGEQSDFINKGATYEWPCIIEEKINIPDKNHFTLLEDQTVLSELRTLFSAYERHLSEDEMDFLLYKLRDSWLKTIDPLLNENSIESPEFFLGDHSANAFQIDFILSGEFSRLIILGEPGSGKTTSLKMMEKRLLDEYEESSDKEFPLLFKASSLEKNETLKSLLAKKDLPLFLLQKRKFFFLIDGLDESADPAHHEPLINDIFNYNQKFILSMRQDFYNRTSKQWKDISIATISPFLDKNIRSYLANRNISPDILDKNNFRELAKNPLTLSLLVDFISEIPNSWLSLGDIYKRYVDNYFKRSEENAKSLFKLYGRTQLNAIFYHYNQIKSSKAFFHHFKQDYLDNADFSGIDFLIAEKGLLANTHQTFAEYFLASLLLDEINQFRETSHFQALCYFDKFILSKHSVIIQFLTELIQRDENFATILLALYAISKININFSGENAISCLNYLEFSFDKLSFPQNIKLEKTFLKNAIVPSSQKSSTWLKRGDLVISDNVIAMKPYTLFSALYLTPHKIYESISDGTIKVIFTHDPKEPSMKCFALLRDHVFFLTGIGALFKLSKAGSLEEIKRIPLENGVKYWMESNESENKLAICCDRYFMIFSPDENVEPLVACPPRNSSFLAFHFEKDIITFIERNENPLHQKLYVSRRHSNEVFFKMPLNASQVSAQFSPEAKSLIIKKDCRSIIYIDLHLKKIIGEYFISNTPGSSDLISLMGAGKNGFILSKKSMRLRQAANILKTNIYSYRLHPSLTDKSARHLKPVLSQIHPENPVIVQRTQPHILQALSLLTKKIMFEIELDPEEKITNFDLFNDFIFMLTVGKHEDRILRYSISKPHLPPVEIKIPAEHRFHLISFHFISENEFYCRCKYALLLFKEKKLIPLKGMPPMELSDADFFFLPDSSEHKHAFGSIYSSFNEDETEHGTYYTTRSYLCIEEDGAPRITCQKEYHSSQDDNHPFTQMLATQNDFIIIYDRSVLLYGRSDYQLKNKITLEFEPSNAIQLVINQQAFLAIADSYICRFFLLPSLQIATQLSLCDFSHYERKEGDFSTTITYQQKSNTLLFVSEDNLAIFHLGMENNQLRIIKSYDLNREYLSLSPRNEKNAPSAPSEVGDKQTLSHFFKHAGIQIIKETPSKKSTQISFFSETGEKKSLSISHRLRDSAGLQPSV